MIVAVNRFSECAHKPGQSLVQVGSFHTATISNKRLIGALWEGYGSCKWLLPRSQNGAGFSYELCVLLVDVGVISAHIRAPDFGNSKLTNRHVPTMGSERFSALQGTPGV